MISTQKSSGRMAEMGVTLGHNGYFLISKSDGHMCVMKHMMRPRTRRKIASIYYFAACGGGKMSVDRCRPPTGKYIGDETRPGYRR